MRKPTELGVKVPKPPGYRTRRAGRFEWGSSEFRERDCFFPPAQPRISAQAAIEPVIRGEARRGVSTSLRSSPVPEPQREEQEAPPHHPPPRGEKLPQRKKFHSGTPSADPRCAPKIPREGRNFRALRAASRGEEKDVFPRQSRVFCAEVRTVRAETATIVSPPQRK